MWFSLSSVLDRICFNIPNSCTCCCIVLVHILDLVLTWQMLCWLLVGETMQVVLWPLLLRMLMLEKYTGAVATVSPEESSHSYFFVDMILGH